jgi:inorganic pyrophosphatase
LQISLISTILLIRLIVSSSIYRLQKGVFRLKSTVSTSVTGAPGTTEYRLNFHRGGDQISPWHEIPVKDGELYNAVIEIPKYTRAEMKVTIREEHNPIAQVIEDGELRYYHGPIFWNYGFITQTWEDSSIFHCELNYRGNDDPLAVVEIGSAAITSGSVVKVCAYARYHIEII